MYKGIKCCEQQLRRVDKALSVRSWICLSHRNLILAEDKRLSGERLYAVFNEVGKMSGDSVKCGCGRRMRTADGGCGRRTIIK